jgi:predicted NAD/FAD-binding protein
MLFDIVRFNQFALDVLIEAEDQDQAKVLGSGISKEDTETIGKYLAQNGYSDAFRDGYLIPITAAVWSTSPSTCIDEFPALTLIRFL